MSDFLPEGYLELYEGLDLVGRAMFGSSWLGVDRYNSDYDETVRSGLPNPKEAERRAKENYSPCRAATLKLRRLLSGGVPDHRNAVPATFLAGNGEMMPIKPHVWGADDTLKIFRTSRIKYNRWN